MIITLLILSAVSIVLLVLILSRKGDNSAIGWLSEAIEERLDETNVLIRDENAYMRQETMTRLRENRQELSHTLADISQVMSQQSMDMTGSQARFLSEMMEQIGVLRTQMEDSARQSRMELTELQKSFEDRIAADTAALSEVQRAQFADMRSEQERAQRQQTEMIETMRAENMAKLDEMRRTVDEQLQQTVEKRFDASFRTISDQLEQVHRGLGEMQQLAAGVGDLRKVLTNVKTRGTFGEIQLGVILDQFLSPEQYLREAHVEPGSANHVEFAVKLPGRSAEEAVLLPIDSKFPTEAYQRLMEAYEDPNGAEKAAKEGADFEREIKRCAREISTKYIRPPFTTDFALLFVPSEGIYAEVLRRPGLTDFLQQTYHITVVGPTNLVAFLNSLQMGFRTLAIEQRTSEVWVLLSSVKAEFGRFSDALDKTRKKLSEAVSVVEKAGVRSRSIERRLREVEVQPGEAEAGSSVWLNRSDPE